MRKIVSEKLGEIVSNWHQMNDFQSNELLLMQIIYCIAELGLVHVLCYTEKCTCISRLIWMVGNLPGLVLNTVQTKYM